MLSGAGAVWLPAEIDWDGHMDLDGSGWALMTFGMIAFWGLLIFAVVWIVRELGRRPSGSRSGAGDVQAPDPAAILDRRLAEGDISLGTTESAGGRSRVRLASLGQTRTRHEGQDRTGRFRFSRPAIRPSVEPPAMSVGGWDAIDAGADGISSALGCR